MSELHGFMHPRSPEGRASLVPDPPWHYSGQMLTIEYRTDPARVAALLPDPLEPVDEDPGAVALIWADWQSCSDTLCPLGPGLVDDWDFHGKRIRTLVNGEVAQDGNTDEMIWDMHYLVADVARTITLVPGDVILSGTPAHSRPVQPGDEVSVEVEGLGVLTNRIVSGPPVREDVGAQPSESEEVVSTAFGGDWELRGIRPPRRA